MAKPENEKSLERKVRNSYLISTVSVALVLFLLGSVGYLIMGALQVTDSMKENMTLYVMLRNNLADDKAAQTGVRLAELSGVREVKFVTKKEAAAELKAAMGGDFEDFLSFNPLPDSYEIKLHAQSSGKEQIRELEKTIAGWSEVDEVFYQRAVAENITTNIGRFNLVLVLFGGALLIISLILLNNTIRLTVYSKRYLINTMKLVGASRWFIMKPFVSRSLLQGIAAWFIAALMFVALVAGLGKGLPDLAWLASQERVVAIVAAMLLLGVLISVLFTTFAVNKFVRMNTAKIYLY